MSKQFPVWDYISEELHARRWSKERLAREMGGDEHHNQCKLAFLQHAAEKVPLNENTAGQLAHAFGNSAELWLNLDRAYRSPTPPTE